MGRLTKAEQECIDNLQSFAAKAFKVRGALKIMSRLADNGLIEWDPFAGTAKLTPAGESAISR